MPGAMCAIMMGRSVAASCRFTTSMYPKDGEDDVSTIPNTQICCIVGRPDCSTETKPVFLNSFFNIHVHVVYLRFVTVCTSSTGRPNFRSTRDATRALPTGIAGP